MNEQKQDDKNNAEIHQKWTRTTSKRLSDEAETGLLRPNSWWMDDDDDDGGGKCCKLTIHFYDICQAQISTM